MSWRIHFSRWLVLACLLLVPGCSGEESFALPPAVLVDPSMGHEGACRTWAVSNCNYQERCQGGLYRWESPSQCIERTLLSCELMTTDPGVSFTDDLLQGCTFPIDCAMPPPDCWGQGTTGVGKPCLWNEACHSGHCFGGESSSLGICGICVCDIQCPAGEGCLLNASGGTCVPLKVGPGAPCVSSRDCQTGVCAQGMVCAQFGQIGDSCGTQGEPLCAANLVCDPNTLQCNFTTLVAFGDPCSEDGGPLRDCKGFASCVGGKCVPPVDDGQPCIQGSSCAWPAECVGNQCILPTIADCSM